MQYKVMVSGLVLAALMPIVAAQEHPHAQELGRVALAVSCTAEAQMRMNHAVAMLHSFWFPEARKNFESVLQADPSCGMAYWGVALTHFGNPFAGGPAEAGNKAGLEAAEKAAVTVARTEREKGYIDAALALYRDYEKLDNRARMRAYGTALAKLHAANPDDTEAAIFHALMMIATAPATDLTFEQQKKAAEILNPLFEKQPQHPGLAHYIIHAFDSPPLAHLALAAARRYADIAPSAPHALHMPSHTFTRVGLWDESIKTNRRSADAELTPGGKAHPMDYMVYAYLQQGRDEDAKAVIDELGEGMRTSEVTGQLSAYNAVAMPARYALEREDWTSAVSLKVVSGQPSAEAVTRFARAIGAARSGDVAVAKAEANELATIAAALKAQNDAQWEPVVDGQRLAVLAWIAHLEGRDQDALRIAREAADREEQVEKHPVTPGPILPVRELLGDILMVHNRPAEALEAYEVTLQREPNRARTLYGAAKAARGAGKDDVARKYYGELVKLIHPTSSRRELAEAKQFVMK